jgi:hypothetical protein
MHLLTYYACVSLIITFCFAAPTKPSNGCGYEVTEIQNIFPTHIKYDLHCSHAI